MKESNYLEKGSYNHPQASGYVVLKQFIFVKKDGKRCLLFRFSNEFSRNIKGFEIMLTQYSVDGEVLDCTRIPYQDIHLPKGHTFTPASGVVVHENCADFRIGLVSFICGPFKYVIKHGKAVAHYDPRGYVSPKTYPASSSSLSIKPVLPIMNKAFGLSAFFGILAVLLFGVFSILL